MTESLSSDLYKFYVFIYEWNIFYNDENKLVK